MQLAVVFSFQTGPLFFAFKRHSIKLRVTQFVFQNNLFGINLSETSEDKRFPRTAEVVGVRRNPSEWEQQQSRPRWRAVMLDI